LIDVITPSVLFKEIQEFHFYWNYFKFFYRISSFFKCAL